MTGALNTNRARAPKDPGPANWKKIDGPRVNSERDQEDPVLDEAMDNLREAAQRIRATQNIMHARGMTENVYYRDLLMRLSF